MESEYILNEPPGASPLHIDYRATLNEQQYAAVSVTGADGSLNSGPVLVIAGAGTGKTRTLTYRVAWLMEHGVAPYRVMLLTFTNKAAKEMLRRVGELVPHDISAIWGGTFHHVCHRILRRHAEEAGLARDFTIIDREDAVKLIDACIEEAEIDAKALEFPKGNVLAEVFSLTVNTGMPLAEILDEQFDYLALHEERIERVLEGYTDKKRATNSVDYDDLLVLCLNLFEEHPDVCRRYQEQFQHVLVDEYQDTNPLQSALVNALSAGHGNVMVVGDDAQSIYSWRGADYRNILGFPERHPGTRIFRVEENYRSLPPILTLANAVIARNVHQFEKNLRPVREGGGKPWVVRCPDGRHQALYVAQRVEELRARGVPYSEMAVLYRAHFHAMELQLELANRRIPHRVTSGLRFFEQAHVKDVCAFLRVAANPQDEVSFRRMAMMLDGVGAKSALKMWREAQPVLKAKMELPDKLASAPKKSSDEWSKVAFVLNRLRDREHQPSPGEMVDLVLEGFYEEYAQATFPNARQRLDDLTALGEFAGGHQSADEFLSQLALLTNLEADDATGGGADNEDVMRLSTIHQAKGLEWSVVFVIGLCDGMFPLGRVINEDATGDALEEERRLFYVSVTRARDELHLCYPQYRETGGTPGFQNPSRFLEELPKEVYRETAVRRMHNYGRW